MKTARTRINYVGASDIEYTEIRPIRPNQSVILAGLGVTGSRVTKEMKDRRYRSTQGAGYSDGLVIHSRPATQDSRHGGGKYSASPGGEHPPINFWSTPPTALVDQRQGTGGSNGVNGVNGGYNQNVMDKIYPHYDMRNPRILFEDEVFVPVTSGHQQNTGGQRSSSVSPVRSPQHNFNMNTSYSGAGGHEEGVRVRHPTNTKNMATTYDVFFDQHLQNLANQETEESPSRLSFSTRSGSTPITARFREASCQTPTEFNMRLSPMITTASRYGGSLSDISVPKIIEDCLEEEEGEDHDNQNESPNKLELDDVTDDELDMIGDFMVKESLDSAATNLDNSIKVRKVKNAKYFYIKFS